MAGSRFAVAFVGLVLAACQATPTPSVGISSAEAIGRAAVFAGVAAADLVASGPGDGAAGPFYQVTGQAASVAVAFTDGRIISMLLTGAAPTGNDVRITAPAAVDVARRFLDERGLEWRGLEESVELRDHGETNEYLVTWQRMDGDVLVPDARTVGVNPATGGVFRFADTRQPYAPPGRPAVGRAAAIEAAIAASALGAAAELEDVELRLVVDRAGGQRLAWWVYLAAPLPGGEPAMAHAIVEVDAATGQATVLGRG